MLTKRQLDALRKMHDENEEMAVEGRLVYVGDERFSKRTFHRLLAHMAIRETDFGGGGVEYHHITEIGRGFLEGKDLRPKEVRCLLP